MFTIIPGCSSNDGAVQDLSAVDAEKLINENISNADFVILDVRTPGEFSSGHLPRAINLDYNDNNFEANLNQLDKNKTYLVYCQAGHRSSSAASMMSGKGFKSVKTLAGGISDWTQQNKPVE
jgi:rhodanese-related sulfurtransferase